MMKRLGLYSLVFAVAATFAGCDPSIDTAYNEQVVVAGFIFANEPVDSIVLHRTTPFGSYYDDLDYAVDSARVAITVDGVEHVLLPTGLKGRYYLPASDLIVQGGKSYTLTVTAPNHQTGGEHHLSSTTQVPMPIHLDPWADSIRGKTFVLDTTNAGAFVFLLTAGPAGGPDQRYLLSVTALDTTYGRIHQRSGEGIDSTQVTRFANVQTGPAIAVTPRFLTWYGPNRITFYAIDTNWTDYQRQLLNAGMTGYQPSLNHVTGGMGVFASAARDTVTIIVVPKR